MSAQARTDGRALAYAVVALLALAGLALLLAYGGAWYAGEFVRFAKAGWDAGR